MTPIDCMSHIATIIAWQAMHIVVWGRGKGGREPSDDQRALTVIAEDRHDPSALLSISLHIPCMLSASTGFNSLNIAKI